MEKIVRKGEIACNKQFLLFSQCFLPYMAVIFHFQYTLKCRLHIAHNVFFPILQLVDTRCLKFCGAWKKNSRQAEFKLKNQQLKSEVVT